MTLIVKMAFISLMITAVDGYLGFFTFQCRTHHVKLLTGTFFSLFVVLGTEARASDTLCKPSSIELHIITLELPFLHKKMKEDQVNSNSWFVSCTRQERSQGIMYI